MRVKRLALVAFSVVLSIGLLSGCAGGGNAPAPGTSASEQLIQLVPAAQGGTLQLPSGASAMFTGGFLDSDGGVTLTRNPSDAPLLTVPGWAPATGSMTATFAAQLGTSSKAQQQTNLTLVFPYNPGQASQILAAQAPVVEIIGASGTLTRISPAGTFDAANSRVTVNVPRGTLDGAKSVKLYLAIDGTLATQPPGPRLWNGSASPPAWIPQPFTVDPTKRTIVMVHGIFSSVETAFPCEQSILNAGNYGQAVGIDYDWTQPPYSSTGGAQALATFVNSLPASIGTIDIEAHSYGTVNVLAALPNITKKIGHVILLGGPLPLNGAPQADPGFLRDLVILGAFIAEPSEVYDAYSSGMIASLATNSSTMQQIAGGLKSLSLSPFVQVAGGSALPQESSSTAIEFLYFLLYGGTTNDGIVEQQSALTQISATTNSITYLNLDHIQLECDSSVIPWVAQYVQPGS